MLMLEPLFRSLQVILDNSFTDKKMPKIIFLLNLTCLNCLFNFFVSGREKEENKVSKKKKRKNERKNDDAMGSFDQTDTGIKGGLDENEGVLMVL